MARYSPSSSIEVLDRVLRDTSAPTGARRRLLQRAAVGAAGVAAASAGILASSALADDRPHGPSNGHGSIDDWGVFTSTTEALTVTILDELLRRTSLHPEVPSEVSLTFDAVYAAELDHWNFISQHFDPSTKHFWIPDGFFGGADDALDLTAVGKGVSGVRRFSSIRTWSASRRLRRRETRSSRATRPRPPGTSPSTACLGKRSPAQARPTISDSRSSSLTTSVISRQPWWAPVSAWGKKARAPGASTISRNLRWHRLSRSARTNRNSSDTRRPAGKENTQTRDGTVPAGPSRR